ncbi:Sulfotransferase family cytosolic 1B member 1 [Cryptotermes secundus]|uniref:Sulfotransferase family cytosolic 1B member 1 n=1 Tax=Cryptotermes secundus TaxID=105785 RepID=A0A2J7PYM5_9NEOP|nr:luciferin sulfotransferase isoform X4 [Cryptotermes secundus]PNF21435.1 Sulfotransferase family cytosolic 1B member 1 [Cryptotermes secundus]
MEASGPSKTLIQQIVWNSIHLICLPVALHKSVQNMLEFNEVNGELGEILLKKFTNQFRIGYVKSRGYVLPEYYRKFGQRVEELEVRDDDLWVVSFPKTGTTWTQEMAWVINQDFDFEGAKVPLPERFPFLDHTPLFDYTDILPNLPELQLPLFVSDSVTYINEMKSPRYIKTHLPWELLPKQIREGTKKPKIIYVARNAKDTCVSYYHHCKILEGYSGSFDNYCKLFLGGSLCFAPFWPHVLNFWKRRDEPNILFLKYEDLKKDLPAVIRKTAAFLGKDLNEEQVDLLAEHLSFARMKSNPAVNYEAAIEINRRFNLTTADGHFMRSGQVGNYKEVMGPELIAEFDRWTQENLAKSELTF